jgi:4-hydroxy-tetrahydrodipicolinate reductase
MHILILGRGKTGALVAEVARQRKHGVAVGGARENAQSAALAPEKLQPVDIVIDFTNP